METTKAAEARIEDVVIRTFDKGSEIRKTAKLMNLNKEYLVDILLKDSRFKDATYLISSESEIKKKAQIFLDLFFKGEINPDDSEEILHALSYASYKKNISKLFEMGMYRYYLSGDISTVFHNTRSLESKRKMALIMLINFSTLDDVGKFVFEKLSGKIKAILTLNDIDWAMAERIRVKRDIDDGGSKFLAEKLGYKNREERLCEYFMKENAVKRRDTWFGRLILYNENLKYRVKEIRMKYWIETPISLDTLKEKAGIILTNNQLESRLEYLLKLPDKFYFAIETAKALGRKITNQELDVHIKNNPGVISSVHDEEWVEFTDDQFIEIMKSESKFNRPVSLRWFWDHYSLKYNKILQRIYKERPDDIKDAWETILEALFKNDFRAETSTINGLLEYLGRSMTEKEKKLYSKKVFGI